MDEMVCLQIEWRFNRMFLEAYYLAYLSESMLLLTKLKATEAMLLTDSTKKQCTFSIMPIYKPLY